MAKRKILQGEIYICELGENIGSEQNGERPCLIVQNNILNETSDVTIVLPITSRLKKEMPTHYKLKSEDYPFLMTGRNTVLCECIRCISKKRIGKLIGTIDERDLNNILKVKEYAYYEKKEDNWHD